MLKPRTSPILSSIKDLSHGFFTRNGGVSTGVFASLNASTKYGDTPQAVSENIQRIEETLQGSLTTLNQVHGADIISIHKNTRNPLIGDGLVTQEPGYMLGVFTADCVPLLWACPKTKTIAAIHSGWKGTLAGIVEKSRAFFTCPPLVVIGPSIQQASFAVGQEVKTSFLEKDPDSATFFLKEGERFLFNLPGYIYHLLKKLDVREIDWIQENTYSSEDSYFSYRRSTHRQEKAFGLMVSAIGWKNL